VCPTKTGFLFLVVMGSLLVGSVRRREWVDNHSPKVSRMPHFTTHSQAKFECVCRGEFLPTPEKICKYSNYDSTQQISHTLFPQLRYLGLPTDTKFEFYQYIFKLPLCQFEELKIVCIFIYWADCT